MRVRKPTGEASMWVPNGRKAWECAFPADPIKEVGAFGKIPNAVINAAFIAIGVLLAWEVLELLVGGYDGFNRLAEIR